MKNIIKPILDLVIPQFRLPLYHGLHGITHWSRVWINARYLCESLGADPLVPCLFSYLHDSQRDAEDQDYLHGPRAADYTIELFTSSKLNLTGVELHNLLTALRGHSGGRTSGSLAVQICWDADRLDLGRVGIRPDPAYLCTDVAKQPDVIERAWRRSISSPQWG
jgi:uncharacterized protein